MNRKRNITITKVWHRALELGSAVSLLAFGTFALATALATQAFAHGGFDHVIGTVSKVDHNVMTVKTAKGDVDVKLASQTEITKNNQKAAIADLKPGTRVVVDVPEGSKDGVAHSVKVGVATSAGQHPPENHK